MNLDFIPKLAEILLAPATVFLVGKFIIGKLAVLENDVQAIKQVLNGYEKQEGLIEVVYTIKKILDRRKQ